MEINELNIRIAILCSDEITNFKVESELDTTKNKIVCYMTIDGDRFDEIYLFKKYITWKLKG